MKRPSWDQFFLDLAETYAARSTCDRLKVGCILVKGNRVVSAGYNGALSGLPHCDDVGHEIDPATLSCTRTVHAETNAITEAARSSSAIGTATAYITHSPCYTCCKLLLSAGIWRIIFSEYYHFDQRVVSLCDQMGIQISQVEKGT